EGAPEASEARGTRLALIGRPNVGKSSLLNRLLGAERAIVAPEPGTTRDAIDTPLVVAGRPYVLIDTAGIRRRGKVHEPLERLGADRRGAGRPLPARGPRRTRLRGGAADAGAQPCPRGRGRGHPATQPRGQGAALLLRHADRPPAARGRRVRQRARAGAGGLRPLPRGTAGPGLPADGRAAPPGAPHAADARRAPCARESHTWSKPPA